MFQPKQMWDKAIYPNRYDIPLIRNIPFDLIEKVLPILSGIFIGLFAILFAVILIIYTFCLSI